MDICHQIKCWISLGSGSSGRLYPWLPSPLAKTSPICHPVFGSNLDSCHGRNFDRSGAEPQKGRDTSGCCTDQIDGPFCFGESCSNTATVLYTDCSNCLQLVVIGAIPAACASTTRFKD